MLAGLFFFLSRFCHGVLTAEEIGYGSLRGPNTIVMSCDHVCRPTVYKKCLLWKGKVFEYTDSGFMETAHFGVEWLSEEEFCLHMTT